MVSWVNWSAYRLLSKFVHVEKKKQHALFYKPYTYFAQNLTDTPGQPDITHIDSLISNGQYDHAREAASNLIRNSLDGLRYLETCVRYKIPSRFEDEL